MREFCDVFVGLDSPTSKSAQNTQNAQPNSTQQLITKGKEFWNQVTGNNTTQRFAEKEIDNFIKAWTELS